MKKVSFLKHDLEIHTSYVEGAHKPGDPVPVALVHTALQDWQRRLSGLMSGLSAEDHVNLTAPKTAWDHVCIGAQTFSAAQFLSAEKHSPAPRTHAGVSSSLYHRQRDTPFIDPQKRLILRPPVEAGYVPAAVSPAFNAKAARGALINERGEIDFAVTHDVPFSEDLRLFKRPPRPPLEQ